MPLVPATERRGLTSVFIVKVNGTNLDESHQARVSEVSVEQSLHLPDMFAIRVFDAGDPSQSGRADYYMNLDMGAYKVGDEVEILMGHQDDPKALTKGEVTSVELEIDQARGPVLTIRGYDRSHRLHRGRQIRSYLQMSDSDIVSKVAASVGLAAQTDSTSTRHEYVLQYNQTNWEFLRELAARNGFELFVQDRTLHFRKPKPGQQPGPELRLGENLLSVRTRVGSAYQAKEVVVRGWDPKSKQPIVGKATSGKLAPKTGLAKSGQQVAQQFGGGTVYVVNHPIDDQTEAKNTAEAIFDELDGTYVQAEGTCLGDPTLKPGVTVKMSTIGQQLSGDYYVTSAVHRISAYEGYTTSFVVSGRQTNTLLELVQGRRDGGGVGAVVVGVVTNNSDPKWPGRVKVRFPWLPSANSDDGQESAWARVASPMAGKGRGFFWLPEVDDEVLVAFEHGDVNRPYVVGALWNDKDNPPKANTDTVKSGKVNERIIQTRAGHVISLDDTDGKERISIKTKAGHELLMDDASGSEKISIKDKTGSNSIVIESSSNKITVKAAGDVNVETKANAKIDVTGNATVNTSGNTSVEAKGSLTLKGMNVSVEATANLTLKANATASLEGNASTTVKASGPVTIQGTPVKIN